MSFNKVLFGIHAVEQALSQDHQEILNLYFDRERSDVRIQKIVEMATKRRIQLVPSTKDKISALADATNHQGVLLRFVQNEMHSESSILELIENTPQALVLILDCIQDPHNLGACMRSALALGVTALIFPEDKSCPVNATVSKVASGAAEQLPYLAVKNLARFMKTLKDAGVWCIGTSLDSQHYLHEIDLKGPIAIVMGAEATGIRQLTEKQCDYLVKIPMTSKMESLNVSVATGISLYEVYRQRLV